MNQKYIIYFSEAIGISLILIALFIDSGSQNGNQTGGQNIKNEDGVQVIRILARGGYSPRQISARADIPVRLEMETKGTYDCSSVFTIPSLGYQKRLPSTGLTTINVPAQKTGTSLIGTCGMGMYSFEIKFN